VTPVRPEEGPRTTGYRAAVRRGTTIALAILLIAIFGAAIVQFLILA
jgi:hypothetical protein